MVGYAGGTTTNPSYHNLVDHTETVKIVYNPDIISYTELLNIFWNAHNPKYRMKRQYMSTVFYHDDVQKQEAMGIKKQFEDKRGQTLYTDMVQFENFYPAEEYHQKYYLQNTSKAYKELRPMYDSFDEFVSSTLVARVNGYIAGGIEMSTLKDELKDLDVPDENRDKLINVLEKLG